MARIRGNPSAGLRTDRWLRMEVGLLPPIVADAASVRRASKLIDMPRSTLGASLAEPGASQHDQIPTLRLNSEAGDRS